MSFFPDTAEADRSDYINQLRQPTPSLEVIADEDDAGQIAVAVGALTEYLKGMFNFALRCQGPQHAMADTYYLYPTRLNQKIDRCIHNGLDKLRGSYIRAVQEIATEFPDGYAAIAGKRISSRKLFTLADRLGCSEQLASLIAHVTVAFGESSYTAADVTPLAPTVTGDVVPMPYVEGGITLTYKDEWDTYPPFWRLIASINTHPLFTTSVARWLSNWALPLDPCYTTSPHIHLPVTNMCGILESLLDISEGTLTPKLRALDFLDGHDAARAMFGMYMAGTSCQLLGSNYILGILHPVYNELHENQAVLSDADRFLWDLCYPTKIYTPIEWGFAAASNSMSPAFEALADKFAQHDLFAVDSSPQEEPPRHDLFSDERPSGVDLFDDGKPKKGPTDKKDTAISDAQSEDPGPIKANSMARTPAAANNTMDIIKLERDDESPDTFLYRLAVLSMQEAIDKDPDTPLSSEDQETLRSWCNRYLFLAPLATTKQLVNNLGLRALIAPLTEKI